MMNIEDIIAVTGGQPVKMGSSKIVTGVSIDSRIAKAGNCFVAIKGAHFDGGSFVNEAVAKGCLAAIFHGEMNISDDVTLIRVSDTVRALGDIAAFWRNRFSMPIVAITGSNGKSTTKQMTASAIRSLGAVLKTEGNFNNLIGLPLTVFRLNDTFRTAILEMGMNASGEIARLTKIARPSVGLITNVSPAHLEFLHSVENVARAKGELFENMDSSGTVVVNIEDPWVKKLAAKFKGKVFTFGMHNEADVRFGRMESRGLESIDMTVYIKEKEHPVHLHVPGTHNVMNAMAAISVAVVLGVPPEIAARDVGKFEPMAMRMERMQLSKGIQLVNDSYNANPLSVKEALRTVFGAKRAGRFIAVLGDMLELGENSSSCHVDVGEAAAKYKVDKLFVFGEHSADVARGASGAGLNPENIETFQDMEVLKNAVAKFVETGDIVLVKGSRGMKMERVVEHLKDVIGVE